MSPAFFRYRFLLCSMPLYALAAIIRQICVPEEAPRLPQITETWHSAMERMSALTRSEAGLCDGVSLEPAPDGFQARLEDLSNDPWFREAFPAAAPQVRMVEIDRVVAPQREVDLDHVEEIRRSIEGKKPGDLFELCLWPGFEAAELKTLQAGPNQVTYSSRNPDLRYLGGTSKPVTEADLSVAPGGHPVAAVTLLVGYGSLPLNAYQAKNRVVLANGFHRIVALRLAGFTHAPVVIQPAPNPDVDFPEQIMGQSRAYLLNSPRPVLLKDFFDDPLTIELKLKPRRKSVRLVWKAEESFIPA